MPDQPPQEPRMPAAMRERQLADALEAERETWDNPLAAIEEFDKAERQRADDLRKLDEAFEYFKTDIDTVAATPSGQRFIYYIMSLCGIFRGTFTGNSLGMWLEGRRSVGIELQDRIANSSERGRDLVWKINSLGSWRLNATWQDKKVKP